MTAIELTKSLHVQCADLIYRAERNICPCCEPGIALVKVPNNRYLWECRECGFARCTIGLRDEGK